MSELHQWRAIEVAGECPEGCGKTLFLDKGGHVTCAWHACPNPAAADEMLSNSGLLRVTDEALKERNARLALIEQLARGKIQFPASGDATDGGGSRSRDRVSAADLPPECTCQYDTRRWHSFHEPSCPKAR